MIKKLILALLLFLVLTALSACPAAGEQSSEKPARILIASDLHYIASTLTDHGAYFTKLVDTADGKAMHYIEELADAFVAEVISVKPDVLVLSGDLSFNGALESHIALAKKLEAVSDAGIPVLVIPGNHDIDNWNAARFEGDTFTRVHPAGAEEFSLVYGGFVREQWLSKAPDSFSYMYPVREDLRILMLDTNSVRENLVSEETMLWLEGELKRAREDGAAVFAVSHQNLYSHHFLFPFGYRIENSDKLLELYSRYGVLCSFSGHMHIQSEMDNGVKEILTSALSIVGNHYAVVDYDGADWSYTLHSADVSGWAREQGSTDENLLDFGKYCSEYFAACGGRSLISSLDTSVLTEGQLELMSETFDYLNECFFTGSPIDLEAHREGAELWRAQPDSFTKIYVMSLIEP